MNIEQEITQLVQFRQSVYQNFDNRADTLMDLVDALSSNISAQSVVQLSLNPHFRRSYSTLFKGVADYFHVDDEDEAAADERRTQEQELMRLIMPYLPRPQQRKFWLVGVDVTPCRRQFAQTLDDSGWNNQDSPFQSLFFSNNQFEKKHSQACSVGSSNICSTLVM